jgi:hypothetical protein
VREGGSKSGPNLTCLAVRGNEATLGLRDDLDVDDAFPEQIWVRAVDGGPLGSGLDRFEATLAEENRAPTDCSPLPETPKITLRLGEVAVNDAP